MSTSDIDRKSRLCCLRRYVLTLGVLLAAQVYQLFGHGVRLLTMSLAFLPVLLYALLASLTPTGRGMCSWRSSSSKLKKWPRRLLGAAAATLSVGMFLQGVLDIAGADSPYLIWFYVIAGVEGALAGVTGWVYRRVTEG